MVCACPSTRDYRIPVLAAARIANGSPTSPHAHQPQTHASLAVAQLGMHPPLQLPICHETERDTRANVAGEHTPSGNVLGLEQTSAWFDIDMSL
jgi:hypothetical protein